MRRQTLSYHRVLLYLGNCVIAASLLININGCGERSRRLPVEGVVTFDGQRIAKGQISFIPASGTDGPTAGSIISDGRYSVAAEKGLVAGRYRVEITAMRPTSRKTQTMNAVTGAMETTEAYESYIPPRYNSESELTADVKSDGANQFDFSLTP